MIRVVTEKFTLEEYFDFCDFEEGRYEFVEGAVTKMLEDSVAANQIAGNVHLYLQLYLENHPYILVQSAVRLEVKVGVIFRIPDFIVFRESGNKRRYATEPTMIVEVISEDTALVDRCTKLREYLSMPSLQHYLIVGQAACSVTMYSREGGRWYLDFYDRLEDNINLSYFRIELPLSHIYKKIVFEPE